MEHLGPMKEVIDGVSEELELTNDPSNNHWVCKGRRSLAVAANLLRQNKIIAIPTDTVYGLAGIVLQTDSIQRLYEIKGRSESKPLCISVSGVEDIGTWGVVDHLSPNLLPAILPGPYTVVLKRTPALNPSLNPGIDTVGIRVPRYRFINNIAYLVGPIALTSANRSNEQSCLAVNEFAELWPQLGGIFHDPAMRNRRYPQSRKGSTIVDLSCPDRYKIVRSGVRASALISALRRYGLKPFDSD
ncbi:threonyl-carbamoyl synthesis 1 [Andrena cerasifolii]|uniref:threonyl-carbamoyl synthesis 1 n=1 Tax=Andrena cerasifolii TaxID=2819439 RepID=UPI0040378A69